jgi:hypothetical protein
MKQQVSPGAIAIRIAVVLLSVATTAAIPNPSSAVYGFATIGTVLAAIAPNRAGAVLVLLADVLGWASAYGSHGSPAPVRTVAFAIALYLLHSAVALAASVPANSFVQPAVVRRWVWHCLPGIGAAIVLGVVVSALGRPSGSLGLDVAGLAAATLAVAPLLWLARTRR